MLPWEMTLPKNTQYIHVRKTTVTLCIFFAAPQLAAHFLPSLRHSPQTWSSYQLGHSLATLSAEISTHGLNSVPLLVFVQRLASLLKTYVG